MKTFRTFMTEVYDKDVMGRSQIKKSGEGGRVGADRKKTAPEMRRMKAVGGGKTEPIAPYKDRKDIGQQRQASTREQQPTQTRGSAADAQKTAAKAERKKAAQARIAARKTGSSAPVAKKTPTASQLLTKKTPAKSVDRKPHKASGLTRTERQKLQRTGDRIIKDVRAGKNKPASAYQK